MSTNDEINKRVNKHINYSPFLDEQIRHETSEKVFLIFFSILIGISVIFILLSIYIRLYDESYEFRQREEQFFNYIKSTNIYFYLSSFF